MIYLCIGENFFRQQLLSAWKNAFAQKYSEFNIFHIHNIKDYDIHFYSQNLLSNGFFSEKNLFIIDDFPGLSGEIGSEFQAYNDFFLSKLPSSNSDHVIVFSSQKVDKRSKLFKLISEIGEIKNFEIPDIPTLKQKLTQLYKDALQPGVIEMMIELKGNNFENIKNELDKILITQSKVEKTDIQNISKDIEESIFEIIENILQDRKKLSILQFRELGEFLDNNYALYNSLLANLRFYFYVFSLQKKGLSSTQIKTDLDVGKRGFLVDKKYKISSQSFFKMYDALLLIDQKMKQGKLLGNTSQDFLYEIEKSILTA